MHFQHRSTCVEVERVRWVEWQQDKLLALGQARIFSPEVEWPASLLIQVVELGYDDGAITCSNTTQNTGLRSTKASGISASDVENRGSFLFDNEENPIALHN